VRRRLSALIAPRQEPPAAPAAPPDVVLGDADLVCKRLAFAPDASAFLVLPAKTTDPVVRLYLRGEMENAYMLARLGQTTVPGDSVVDLGCHVGTFAVGAAAMNRRVLALDAAPLHIDLVERSRAMNGFSNLTVVHAVISMQPGAVPFKEAGLFGAVDFTPGADAPLVRAVRLDDLVSEFGQGPVRFLKMDIEGSEFDALMTGRTLLERDRPVILFESNDPTLRLAGHSVREVRELLEQWDYKVFRVEGDRWVYAPPEQMQPEAWVDMLALSSADQERWRDRLDWQWPEPALAQRCREWAALPYPNTRAYLLAEIRSRDFDASIRDEIAQVAEQLEHAV
jgi:FkbM family methyltransferase